jgi:hypothetical protein
MKMRAETNATETERSMQSINETKFGYLNSYVRLTKD